MLKYKGHFGVLLFLFLFINSGLSKPLFPDTIIFTLDKAEKIFFEKNLQLLAQQCNIDAARAQVLQSRLWDNPVITVNQNVYNTGYNKNGAAKWFPLSDSGETSFQVQQIIYLAGKRNKRIKLADFTAQKTEYLFYDLLRTLKYQLRSDFYNLYFSQQSLSVYKKEIESLSKLVGVFENQYQKGYVSKKELLRLKASLFSLENEKLDLENQLTDTRSDFSLLLRLNNVYPLTEVNNNSIDSVDINNLNINSLIDTATEYRYDLKAAETDVKFSELNLSYQKVLAIPDLQLIAGWDKNGSYVHNYNYVGIQVGLPFFNRNQGNIKSAKYTYQSSQYLYQASRDIVANDIINAYSKALQNDMVYKQFDKKFNDDFASMQDEVLKNYEKRNISLLEFLDFYDAYKQNSILFNTLQFNRANAFENLNFSVGKNIVTF